MGVLPDNLLNTATTFGGCLCGTSVCTVGRICDEPNSMCFIPPCPYDGLSGEDAGKKVVPEVYSAGCWCAKKSLFSTDFVEATIDGGQHPSARVAQRSLTRSKRQSAKLENSATQRASSQSALQLHALRR